MALDVVVTPQGIHLAVDGDAFPDAGWRDNAVVVLGWWIEAALRAGEAPSANSFMNGPYEFVTEPRGDDLRIAFRRRTASGDVDVREPVVVPRAEYEAALLRAADAARGGDDADGRALHDAAARLRASRETR